MKFFVEEHNTQMPHSAFAGQAPDEMYFGTAVDLPTQLAAARSKARVERLAANRAMTCKRVQCSASQPSRIANSSMISALTLLRTPLCERSAHTAAKAQRAVGSICFGTSQLLSRNYHAEGRNRERLVLPRG